jgi:hypothetical protein
VFLIFSQAFQIFSLKRNWLNDYSQKLSNWQNFNSWMIKLTKTPILPNFNLRNDYLFKSLQIIYNYSVFRSSNFCISFNQERKSERIDRKLITQIPNLSSSSQKVHMLHRAISRNRHYFSHKAQSTRNWKSHLGTSYHICSGT